MKDEVAATREPRRMSVMAMAIAALRKVSMRKGYCTDCPYRGNCQAPDKDDVVDARSVDWHVSVTQTHQSQRPSG